MAENTKEKRGLKNALKGIRTELKKVVWPTKKEIGAYTTAVIIVCAFFALAFWVIDSGVLALLKGLLKISM